MPTDPHIILLYGNDEYAIARRVQALASSFTDQTAAQMNSSRLEAETMTEDELNTAVNAAPFLADHRLVLLANPSRRYREADAREKFLQFISKAPTTTRLVMWEHMELKAWGTRTEQHHDDDKHWLVAWMKKQGLGLERYALPVAGAMQRWIVNAVKSEGGEIAGAAAARLADLVGTDTRQAAQEITKLLTYVNWSRPITAADVDALSPLTAEPDIFAMVDALAAGQIGKAQRLLHRLLETQDAWSTWGMIVRQFRLLLLAREVIDQGGGEREALKALGGPPFVARKALGQARGFTIDRLEAIYRRLLEVDEAAKTGRMPLDLGMDVLLAELAG